jgi:hypothetical protein
MSNKLKDDIKSFVTTFFSVFVSYFFIDGAYALDLLWSGSLERATFAALGVACIRAGLKTLISMIYPTYKK